MRMHENPLTIGVVSLGCSKNTVDTEGMLGLLQADGHTIVNDPAEADVLIINTCGFIESAKQESIDSILECAQYKKNGRCKLLVATGCLIERYRSALAVELPEVDILLGVREYDKLPGLLRGREDAPAEDAPRLLTTPHYSAYLRVADGCSNRCTYCAIPLIRGPLTSAPMEALLAESERLVAGGVTELTLIAQDTSGYGRELYGKPMLMELMRQITDIEKLRWLRVLYTYPDTVTEELVAFMAENDKVCNYLDMPLQHCNDTILSAMHRRGSRAHIETVLRYIRTHAPDFILRTTMMVGFPGETEAQFEELLSFLAEYPFDRLGAFAFSPEEDTEAALLPNQVAEDVKARRLDAVMRAQQPIAAQRNARRIGTDTTMLVEKIAGGFTYGRSYGEAPEVDGHIQIPYEAGHTPGIYLPVRLLNAGAYDFTGEAVRHEHAQ